MDPEGYRAIRSLIPETYENKGKVLAGAPQELRGCKSLRAGKLRLVYRPGSQPKIIYLGYRRNVYHAHCDN